MSTAAAQAAAFYREVGRTRVLWTIKDAGGFPAPKTTDGRAQPFWSSRSRAERIIASAPAYGGFEPVEIPWKEFLAKWVPGLTEDGIRIGVNWSGPRATGYDLTPEEVVRNVDVQRRLSLVREADAGALTDLPCPPCGRPTVRVRYTHPAPTEWRTWFICSSCGFEMRAQNSGRPQHFRDDLVDRDLQERDRR